MRRVVGLFSPLFSEVSLVAQGRKSSLLEKASSRFDRAGASRRPAKCFTARWLVEARARRRTAPPGVLHRPFYSIYEAPRFFSAGAVSRKNIFIESVSAGRYRAVWGKKAPGVAFFPTRCVNRLPIQFQLKYEKALDNRVRVSGNGKTQKLLFGILLPAW